MSSINILIGGLIILGIIVTILLDAVGVFLITLVVCLIKEAIEENFL